MTGGPPRALFDLYPASSRPLGPPRPLGNAGGLSGAALYRFRSGRGDLVARRWPDDRPPRARLRPIHSWLARAGDLGFVPVPLTTLDGRTLVDLDGRTWEVAPWMPGQADPIRPMPREHLRAAFGGLAAFLSRVSGPVVEGPSPGLALRLDEIRALQGGGFDAIRGRLARSPVDPAASLGRRWLDRASKLAPSFLESIRAEAGRPVPLQPCLRDARADHFLFEGSRLSGLVDFGAMGVDSVAGDLARLLGEAVGPDRAARREALEAFEAIRPLSESEIRAILAFERANALLAPLTWIRWRFVEGRTFERPDAVASGLARCLERLDEVGTD